MRAAGRSPACRKVIRDSLQSRSPFKLEFRIAVKDGIRHIRALANRVLNKEGEVERLLGINMDMTEVKQLNEALFQEKSACTLRLIPSVKPWSVLIWR